MDNASVCRDIVTGRGLVGSAIAAHPDGGDISFTGSGATDVGVIDGRPFGGPVRASAIEIVSED